MNRDESHEESRKRNLDDLNLADDIAAVEEALDDLENGDEGIPLEVFDREIRARYNLQPRP